MINENDIEQIDVQKKAAHRIDEDHCQVPGCEEEVVVDDMGFTLCYEHSCLPEFEHAIRRAQEKEEFKGPYL